MLWIYFINATDHFSYMTQTDIEVFSGIAEIYFSLRPQLMVNVIKELQDFPQKKSFSSELIDSLHADKDFKNLILDTFERDVKMSSRRVAQICHNIHDYLIHSYVILKRILNSSQPIFGQVIKIIGEYLTGKMEYKDAHAILIALTNNVSIVRLMSKNYIVADNPEQAAKQANGPIPKVETAPLTQTSVDELGMPDYGVPDVMITKVERKQIFKPDPDDEEDKHNREVASLISISDIDVSLAMDEYPEIPDLNAEFSNTCFLLTDVRGSHKGDGCGYSYTDNFNIHFTPAFASPIIQDRFNINARYSFKDFDLESNQEQEDPSAEILTDQIFMKDKFERACLDLCTLDHDYNLRYVISQLYSTNNVTYIIDAMSKNKNVFSDVVLPRIRERYLSECMIYNSKIAEAYWQQIPLAPLSFSPYKYVNDSWNYLLDYGKQKCKKIEEICQRLIFTPIETAADNGYTDMKLNIVEVEFIEKYIAFYRLWLFKFKPLCFPCGNFAISAFAFPWDLVFNALPDEKIVKSAITTTDLRDLNKKISLAIKDLDESGKRSKGGQNADQTQVYWKKEDNNTINFHVLL